MMLTALLLLLASPQDTASPPRTAPAQQADRIDAIMAASDGRTKETAYKVASVADEYAILRRLGLRPEQQSLVVDEKPYDQLTATDPKTNKKVELWFDISSFFGKAF